MLYRNSDVPFHPGVATIATAAPQSVVPLLCLLTIVLTIGWLASCPAIGLPAEPDNPLPTLPDDTPAPTATAKDLGDVLFPDYFSTPFSGWRVGSDQPFSLIPVQPDGKYEAFMQIPAPRQKVEQNGQQKNE